MILSQRSDVVGKKAAKQPNYRFDYDTAILSGWRTSNTKCDAFGESSSIDCLNETSVVETIDDGISQRCLIGTNDKCPNTEASPDSSHSSLILRDSFDNRHWQEIACGTWNS